MSRKTWLPRELRYVERLFISMRGAFLVIREAYADLYSFMRAVKVDYRLSIHLSRDMALAPIRID